MKLELTVLVSRCVLFFFFKQKTAYDMRISDWSSDVCSSDLQEGDEDRQQGAERDQDALASQQRAARRWRLKLIIVDHPALPDPASTLAGGPAGRSEERRVGKECVSTCRSRW